MPYYGGGGGGVTPGDVVTICNTQINALRPRAMIRLRSGFSSPVSGAALNFQNCDQDDTGVISPGPYPALVNVTNIDLGTAALNYAVCNAVILIQTPDWAPSVVRIQTDAGLRNFYFGVASLNGTFANVSLQSAYEETTPLMQFQAAVTFPSAWLNGVNNEVLVYPGTMTLDSLQLIMALI